MAEINNDARAQNRRAFLADSPGYWPMDCHNTYHAEAGMLTTFDYLP